MTSETVGFCRSMGLLAVACLCTAAAEPLQETVAGADGDDEITNAVVVFLRDAESPRTGPAAAFIDNEFHGELPRGSYLKTEVGPGPHLISGEWVHLASGGKYCLVWSSYRWLLHSPAADAVFRQTGARRVARADPREARHRALGRQPKYDRALRKAGEPTAAGLPATFDGVFHTDKLIALKNLFRVKVKGGRLSIDRQAVSFDSGRKHVEVPVDRLMGVSFAGYRPSDADPWIGLFHGEKDELQVEYFSPRRNYNSVFIALMEAADLAPALASSAESEEG